MEIWKPIKNYEGLYEVSNYGRIKSLKRSGLDGRILNEKILKHGNNFTYQGWSITVHGRGDVENGNIAIL